MKRNSFIAGAIILFLCSVSAVSPGYARSVGGTVKDTGTGAGIPSVIVKILETGDSTQTNGSGFYFFNQVPDGSYTFFVGKQDYAPLTIANTHVPNSCCAGKRGNVTCTGIIDLSDLSALVSYLTGGGFVLCCLDASNVNGTGIVDLSDLSALVSYLTGGGFVLMNCP